MQKYEKLSPNTTCTTIDPRISRHDTSLQLVKWSHIYPKTYKKELKSENEKGKQKNQVL